MGFVGVGLMYMGAVRRPNLACFSETCLHEGINWGVLTYCDIVPSYGVMGDKYICK